MSIAVDPAVCPVPQVELLETDGEPLESDWHRLEMNLLIEVVTYRFFNQFDFFVGGNMFIYYNEEQARNLDYRGPDFFFVKGARLNPPRPYWAVWREGGRYPNLIIELTSPTTAKEDHTTKKDIYEQIFRTPDYFIFDPATNKLEGWRLVNQKYQPLEPNESGWLWCEELQLWLGTWDGLFQGKPHTYLRFYERDGILVPNLEERARSAEAEVARLKALLNQSHKNGQ